MKNLVEEKVIKAISDSKVLKSTAELDKSIELSEQGIDSLDLSNVLLCVEEELEITIPDEDIEMLKTINDIVKYVENKM